MLFRALIAPKPAEPLSFPVEFDGRTFNVTVKRLRQARRYTLRVQAATRGIVLTMPLRGSLREARRFADAHGGWIATRLKRLPAPAPFTAGALVPLRGIDHCIEHRRGARGAASHVAWTEVASDGAQLLCVTGHAPHLRRRVLDYLKREAQRDLEAASRKYAAAAGVSFKRISLRDPSSRWGSCSTNGVLSYSWRLIMAPPFVLDYLAAHEVAHLVEMNHSARFWKLVRQLSPDVDRANAWLNTHGTALHRYGVSGG